MDMSKITGPLSRNKVALGAVGVLAVLGLAWQARSKPGAGADAAQPAQPATSYSAGGQTAGIGGYDSTSSDVYNAIQPQLEALQRLYDQIPVPSPSSTAGPASTVQDGYYQPAGEPGIFSVKNGVLEWLSQPEYEALGAPARQIVTKADPVWSLPGYNGYKVPWPTK